MHIELTPDAQPVRVRFCNYAQEMREFMKTFVSNLVRCGMAYFNPTSPFACAPLLVPKPGPAKFRFTVDLHLLNKYTVRHQLLMQNLEHELSDLGGCKYFATFNVSHGHFQVELDRESQAIQSLITPDGIYSTTRVMHGIANVVTYLQPTIVRIVPEILKMLLEHWLDDVLKHAKSLEGLMSTVRSFSDMWKQYNIKLPPRKCFLYKKEVTWWGCKISEEGL